MFGKVAFLCFVLAKWIPSYLATRCRRRPKPAHILFCMVDHLEPGHGRASPEIQKERMERLVTEYPKLADRHTDADGLRPKRTWFFPPHDHRHGNLRALVSLCEGGYGEVELHLHHGKAKPDNAERLERTIRSCVEEYSRFGVFGTENGDKRYAFIHGDWALANSRKDGKYCGVTNELQILRRTGCYADFTFPSCDECNPSQINSIYYAKDNGKPKPYDRGTPASVGSRPDEGLLMVQGPLHPILLDGGVFRLRAFGDDITVGKPRSLKRADYWVSTWIHVIGRPDWVFVKVHTHGATDADVVLGPAMDETFRYLEDHYNDGVNYLLHYVTARELYNIVCAAEDGRMGDPSLYRNYRVSSPSYDSAPRIMEASEGLMSTVYETYAD